MTKPMPIVDLDHRPRASWVIDGNAAYLWRNRLWVKEKVGCCLCVEQEGPEFVTLSSTDEDGAEHFHCMEHGELTAVPYSMKKVYTIQIGDVLREGTEDLADTMLFPAVMDIAARNELVGRLLDEAQAEEAERGPSP